MQKCLRAANKGNGCLPNAEHSRGVFQGTATHCYVMPYLQTADHMHLQIPQLELRTLP